VSAQIIAPIVTLVLGWLLSEIASYLRERRQERVGRLERGQKNYEAASVTIGSAGGCRVTMRSGGSGSSRPSKTRFHHMLVA